MTLAAGSNVDQQRPWAEAGGGEGGRVGAGGWQLGGSNVITPMGCAGGLEQAGNSRGGENYSDF